MSKKKFSTEYLKKLGLPYDGDVMEDKIIDNDRWTITHEIVFEDKGKFYKTRYSEGATEMQDERPWEYEDEVECTEVELREVTIQKWLPIDDKNKEKDNDDLER